MTIRRALLTALTATTALLTGCTTVEQGKPVAAPDVSVPASPSASSAKPSTSGKPSASNSALTEIDVCGRVDADMLSLMTMHVLGKSGTPTCKQTPTELNKAGYPVQEAHYQLDGKVVMAVVVTVYNALDMQGYVKYQLEQNPGKVTAYDVMSLPGYAGQSNFDDLKFVMGTAAGVNGQMFTGQVLLEKKPDEAGMSTTALLLRTTITE
ncbi:hypothetical protein [Actinosynnema sp.]|uniref:hypothetical protein n=1 Tax=Actinosynnema sp. TaxID=1872144 RepID=UPI003F84B0FA